MGAAALASELSDVQRSEHVVLNGLARGSLHERNVLVGSSMKHHLRLIGSEAAAQCRLMGNRADFYDNLDALRQRLGFNLMVKLVGGVLVDVEDDNLRGLGRKKLAHQFAADRATPPVTKMRLPTT